MPLFQVRARDEKGALRTPIIDAESSQAAASQARAAGLFVVECKPHRGHLVARTSTRVRLALLPIAPEDQALVFRHLAPLVKTGSSPSTALRKAGARIPDPRLADLCREMAGEVDEGAALSAVLAARTGVFPAWVAGAVAAAEQGGRSEEILASVHEELRQESQFATRFAVPLAYLRASVVLGVVVPTLPFIMTLGVTGWGVLAGMVGILASVLVYGGGFLRRYGRLKPGGAASPDRAVVLVPGLGAMRKELALRRFARIFHGLQASGLSLYEAWMGACPAVDDPAVSRALEAGGRTLAGEGGLSEALRLTGLYDREVIDAAERAEATGEFDAFHTWLLERAESRAEGASDAGRKGMWRFLLLVAGAVIMISTVIAWLAYMGNILAKFAELLGEW
jgi:type II secretory pathway component PulF